MGTTASQSSGQIRHDSSLDSEAAIGAPRRFSSGETTPALCTYVDRSDPGRSSVVGVFREFVDFYNPSTSDRRSRIRFARGGVVAAAIIDDMVQHAVLAAAAADGKIILYALPDMSVIRTLKIDRPSRVVSLDHWGTDCIAAAYSHGVVQCFDARGGQLFEVVAARDEAVTHVRLVGPARGSVRTGALCITADATGNISCYDAMVGTLLGSVPSPPAVSGLVAMPTLDAVLVAYRGQNVFLAWSNLTSLLSPSDTGDVKTVLDLSREPHGLPRDAVITTSVGNDRGLLFSGNNGSVCIRQLATAEGNRVTSRLLRVCKPIVAPRTSEVPSAITTLWVDQASDALFTGDASGVLRVITDVTGTPANAPRAPLRRESGSFRDDEGIVVFDGADAVDTDPTDEQRITKCAWSGGQILVSSVCGVVAPQLRAQHTGMTSVFSAQGVDESGFMLGRFKSITQLRHALLGADLHWAGLSGSEAAEGDVLRLRFQAVDSSDADQFGLGSAIVRREMNTSAERSGANGIQVHGLRLTDEFESLPPQGPSYTFPIDVPADKPLSVAVRGAEMQATSALSAADHRADDDSWYEFSDLEAVPINGGSDLASLKLLQGVFSGSVQLSHVNGTLRLGVGGEEGFTCQLRWDAHIMPHITLSFIPWQRCSEGHTVLVTIAARPAPEAPPLAATAPPTPSAPVSVQFEISFMQGNQLADAAATQAKAQDMDTATPATVAARRSVSPQASDEGEDEDEADADDAVEKDVLDDSEEDEEDGPTAERSVSPPAAKARAVPASADDDDAAEDKDADDSTPLTAAPRPAPAKGGKRGKGRRRKGKK